MGDIENDPRTVFELHEVAVEAPLSDGARAYVRRIGILSTLETAKAAARAQIAERSGGSSSRAGSGVPGAGERSS